MATFSFFFFQKHHFQEDFVLVLDKITTSQYPIGYSLYSLIKSSRPYSLQKVPDISKLVEQYQSRDFEFCVAGAWTITDSTVTTRRFLVFCASFYSSDQFMQSTVCPAPTVLLPTSWAWIVHCPRIRREIRRGKSEGPDVLSREHFVRAGRTDLTNLPQN